MAIMRDPLRGHDRPVQERADAELVAELMAMDAGSWAVLTGAGMSTDSGIPDYRGPTAVPRTPMTFQTFLSHPAQRARYWARSWVGWGQVDEALPNAGHRALAEIAPAGIITQNVDGLHEAAGSDPVIDLHGRLDRVVCLDCGTLLDRDDVQRALDELNPDFLAGLTVSVDTLRTAPDGDVDLEETAGFRVVDCPRCGGILKPDVVFFGESVPAERVRAGERLLEETSGLAVFGTSLAVHSGLRFVRRAVAADKPVVVVTDGPTRADDLPISRSVSRVADFLGAWLTALREQRGDGGRAI